MSTHKILVNWDGSKLVYVDESGKEGTQVHGKQNDKFQWGTNGFNLDIQFKPLTGHPFDSDPGPVINVKPGSAAFNSAVKVKLAAGCFPYTATVIPAVGEDQHSDDPQVIIDGKIAPTFVTMLAGLAIATIAVLYGLSLLDRKRSG